MKIWHWFCQLCTKAPAKQVTFLNERKQKSATVTGTEICSRVCGHSGCHCGGSMRGLYCIWSYYRE